MNTNYHRRLIKLEDTLATADCTCPRASTGRRLILARSTAEVAAGHDTFAACHANHDDAALVVRVLSFDEVSART